ncbi:MAG TPA: TolC family outer membrane protein [Macromonas sp.]|nr:TolC family outer membrane protein [Macromonas sp.]
MIFRLKPLPIVALLATIWGSAQAQALPPELVQATKTAIVSSPDVQERWKALRGREAGVDVTRAGWRPQADLSAYVGREHLRMPNQNLGNFDISGAELELTQLLFDGGVVSSSIRAANLNWRKSYAELNQTSESVALTVVGAYLDLLRQQELLKAATENYINHKTTLDMLSERVRATVSRRVDLEQATARLARAEAAMVTLQINHHTAAQRYLRMVGSVPLAQLPDWPEAQNLAATPASAQEALQQGIRTNPALLASVEGLLQAEQTVEGRKAAYLPKAQAHAAMSTDQNLNGVRGKTRKDYIELLLAQNIYRGGADAAREEQARELALKARDEVEATCRAVQQDLSVAFKDIDTFTTQARLADQHRLAAEKSKVAYKQQFDIGQRTLLDLLDTQNEYFEAQSRYTQARFDQLQAQARTLAGMGQLVATVTGVRHEAPATDSDLPAADPTAYCSVQTTPMDSLERIKASLELPSKPKVAVVLLPNPDGTVGKIIVTGPAGAQEISQANHGAPLTGATPGTPVSEQEIQAKFGPALQAQPALPEKFVLFFQSGQTRLTKASEAEWKKVVNHLRNRQTLDLTVAGHADTISTESVNEKLALKRAQAVEQRLRKSGFKDVQIIVESYGARSLMVPTPTQTDEPKNRRVVINAR